LKHGTGQHKAYEIWEPQGRTGSPDDHWFEAEREPRAEEEPTATARDRSEATVEAASLLRLWEPLRPPAAALAKSNRSPRFIERLIAASDALERPHTAFGEIPLTNRECRRVINRPVRECLAIAAMPV
jgi:hypothetical protein